MSSSSIQPDDGTLSRDDLSRAYFCSEAAYKSSVTSATAFLQKTQCDHPIVRFEKVHMSLELLGQQKFLVAYTEDAIFIAFRGTETLSDLAADLKMVNHPKFGGAFHAGFFKRADVFMGSDQNPMKGLLSLNKRIIFCGHSLGGAVAHMVLLRYLLENNWNLEKSQGQYSNSLISVAFGAPHICDEDGARNINANKTLRWRFKNFVNQSDPVPCLLHSVANTLAKFKASLESNEIFRTTFPLEGVLTPVVRFMDAIVHRDVSEAFIGAFDIGTTRIVDRSNKILIAPLLSRLARRAAPEPGSSKYNEPDFYPIGTYIFIQKQANNWPDTDLQMYPLHLDDTSKHMPSKLKDVRFGFQDWEHHKLENYKTVLMKSGLIDSPQVNFEQPHDFQANNVVSTPAPIITRIRLEWADSTHPFITLTGDNLLFLREPVKINEMEWQTTVQEDQKITALGPSSSNISTETIPFVVVNTAFGKCSKTIMEGFPEEQPTTAICEKLEKTVQVMMIMKSFGSDPSSDHLSKLDAIIQCGPKMQSKKLSTTLEKIRTTKSDNEVHFEEANNEVHFEEANNEVHFEEANNEVHFEEANNEVHFEEANKMTKAVTNFLTSALKFSYREDGIFFLTLLASPLISAGIAAPIAALVWGPIVCMGVMGAGQATMFAGHATMAATISKKEHFSIPMLVESYKKILVFACEEASEWSMSNPRLGVDLTYLESSSLEEVLQKQVEVSNDKFKEMIQKAHTYPQTQGQWMRILCKLKIRGQETSPKLKHRDAQYSDHECRISFLRRIKIIVDTEKLYTELVKGTQFWGILGTEDAGKSTFIEKALQRYGPQNPLKLPKCGTNTHTKIVEPYQLNDSVWLVDFPGEDGLGGYAETWTQFQKLPSICVLILEFQNDIKRGQKELYDKIKASIGTSEIKVVFNKVDIKYYPGEEDDETDYFEKQKDNTVSKLGPGCKRENIYYVCFEPTKSNQQEMRALKKMGVLGFEDFFNELGLYALLVNFTPLYIFLIYGVFFNKAL